MTDFELNQRDRLICGVCQIYAHNFEKRSKCLNRGHDFYNPTVYTTLYFSKNNVLNDKNKPFTYINGWCRRCVKDLVGGWNNDTVVAIVEKGQTFNG